MKLQPVPPSMPSEAQSVRVSGINSTANDIDGGTGFNLIFFQIKYNYIDQSIFCIIRSLSFTNKHRVNKGFFNRAISHQQDL